MNIKKSSLLVLGLVFGVSVILYIFDSPILPSISTVIPSTIPSTIISVVPQSTVKTLTSYIIYQPEGRSESIQVTLELENSLITKLSSIHSGNSGKSVRYQTAFEGEIQGLVIGKDIKTLNLSRVAGASNTTAAFMQALDAIRAQI